MTSLLVTNDFPPKVGGIQSYLWELWRRLPPDEATVLTTPHEGATAFDAARRDHTDRAAQHLARQRVAHRHSPVHRHLGTVPDHDVRRPPQARPDVTERQHGVEEQHLRTNRTRVRVHGVAQSARRHEEPIASPHDRERLRGVELGRARIPRGEHVRRLGREPSPQLVEVRLDAAHLGWEVVSDEQRRHGIK